MNTKHILTKTTAIAAAVIFCGVAAHAQVATLRNGSTAGEGELFLGFRATTPASAGRTTNIVVDLGSSFALAQLAPGSVVTLANLGTDLAVYNDGTLGSWFNRTDLLWSAVSAVGNTIVAGQDPTNTLYGSVSATGLFPLATVGYTRAANGAQGGIATTILSMAAGLAGTGSFTDSPAGSASFIAVENTAGSNSWSSKFTGTPFGNFSQPPGQVFEQAFSAGTLAGTSAEGALDVYRMFKTGVLDGDLGNATTGPGSYQFTLTINSAGLVQAFVLPVPEPASIALLFVGGMMFFGIRHRPFCARTQAAA